MQDDLIRDKDGNLFHLPGTRIREEVSGQLTYDCPHCGRRPVPRSMVADLAKYAGKRTTRR